MMTQKGDPLYLE